MAKNWDGLDTDSVIFSGRIQGGISLFVKEEICAPYVLKHIYPCNSCLICHFALLFQAKKQKKNPPYNFGFKN